MPGIHDGHRQRLKDRFLKNGLDDFEEHNVLELLTFFSIPQRDTNELAHRLIVHFGTLNAVFDADFEELCRVEGVGRNTAIMIKLVPDLARRYYEGGKQKDAILSDAAHMASFLRPKFIGHTKERIYLLCLDGRGRVVFGDFIIEGTIDSAPMYIRNIMEIVMRCRAASVVLAHNHPRGMALPSMADIASTRSIFQSLSSAGVKLIDHFIFSGTDYTSMRDSGFFEF